MFTGKFSFLLFFVCCTMQSQILERELIKGKVVASHFNPEGIYVLNISSKKETITKEGGCFSISAKLGDSIMFSSIQLKGKIIEVDSIHLEPLFLIKMETMVNQLNEVMVVQYKNINPFDLGILLKPAKIYTPAERKLRTATGLNARIGLNSAFTIDPIINLLSGRTAMLKKELEAEKKEKWIERLEDLYEEQYVVEKLKVPVEYLKGFFYYAVENEAFLKALDNRNKSLSTFLLGQLAKEYLEIIAYEK